MVHSEEKATSVYSCKRLPAKGRKVLIEVENVWKVYTMGEVEVAALRGLSMKVREGDFVIVMGPSGSGKSTAMNMIGCLDTPTKGRIFLDGYDISCLEESELAKIRGKKIGFIFQKFNLMQSLTALENVALAMSFQNIPASERISRAEHLLNIVGLSERKDHRPSEMSGGEQQRVAIARALANDPEIILADEPTGNLDSKTGVRIMEIILDLYKNQKKTVIIVTHDSRFEKLLRNERVLYLKDGCIEHEKRG